MTKSTDLLKFLKSKKASKEFMKAVSTNMVDIVKEDMFNTINNYVGRKMSIQEWNDEHENWVGITVASAIAAPKAINAIPEVIAMIIDKSDLIQKGSKFEREIMATVSINGEPSDTHTSDAIYTTITFSSGAGDNAEAIYSALKKTFQGGEIVEDDKTILTLNPTPGVNSDLLKKGADAIRDHYVNKSADKLMSKLSDDLRDELKKYKEK